MIELAHGVGGRGDLPLPLWMFSWAASIALVLSFIALGFLWTQPKLAALAARPTHPLGAVGRGLVAILRAVALALYVTALAAGFWGIDDPARNLLPVTLYVAVWVGSLVLSGLVLDLWSLINPLVTLTRIVERLLGRTGETSPNAPSSMVGDAAAAVGMFVFLYYELIHLSGASPRSIGRLLAVHTVVSVVVGVRWGSSWLRRYEPFSAVSYFVGHLAPFGVRYEPSSVTARVPMSGLATVPTDVASVALLMVVLGGTTFDGFAESRSGRSLFGTAEGWTGTVALTAGLAASVLLVTVLYTVGCWWVARVTGERTTAMIGAFAPSVIPIVFGYALAHYAQLLVDEIQSFWFRLSDPFGKGWDLFGSAAGEVDYNVVSPDAIAWVQVLAILFGHIGAVAVAHDRSLERFDAKDAWRSQFAMLVVMVAYSTLGLWLLLSA